MVVEVTMKHKLRVMDRQGSAVFSITVAKFVKGKSFKGHLSLRSSWAFWSLFIVAKRF